MKKRNLFIVFIIFLFSFVLISCGNREYVVTWKNDDGKILQVDNNVSRGEIPYFKGDYPTKESTYFNDFTFIGWDPAVDKIKKNTVYVAKFQPSVRKFEITWNDADGTLLGKTMVPYGEIPSFNLPENTDEWIYTTWVPLIKSVSGNTTYTAHRTIKHYDITYKDYEGKEIKTLYLPYGSWVIGRVNPPININYIFDGWYTEKGEEADAFYKVKEDVTLYAKYKPSEFYLNSTAKKGLVKIAVKSYNGSKYTGITSSSTSYGSGVIFSNYLGKYYVLTNNHVISKQIGYNNVEYSIIDYYGIEHKAQLSYGGSSANYDLAVLNFVTPLSLQVLKIAENNPEVGTGVVVLGYPKGGELAITYGNVLDYKTVIMEGNIHSKVTFPALIHDANTEQGSSGGPILNYDLEIIGIHYGSSVLQNNYFGTAIPIEKVKEFLLIMGLSFLIN